MSQIVNSLTVGEESRNTMTKGSQGKSSKGRNWKNVRVGLTDSNSSSNNDLVSIQYLSSFNGIVLYLAAFHLSFERNLDTPVYFLC